MTPDLPDLHLTRELLEPTADRRRLARSVATGVNQRVVRGAYVSSERWQSLDARRRYLLRVISVARTRSSRPVLSHQSAAAIYGLPVLGEWPDSVHITVPPTVGIHSRAGLAKHRAALPQEDVIEVDGLLVTSLGRTVLDLAASTDFLSAVIVADRALLVDRFGSRKPLLTPEGFEAVWERARPIRAHSRVRAVLSFADTRSESPLESVSRVHMRMIGVPRPRLQVPHYDSAGYIGDPDFTWDGYEIVGEADGDVKYLSEAVRAGRSAEQVVLDEKIREDRFRALPRSVVRWRWQTAISPALLRKKLVTAGLPLGHKW